MKAISVFDLKLIPELKDMTIFDIVHPDNDKLVNPFLEIMGFDLQYPLMYTVSQHRTLQKDVKVGFVIRGELNVNRKHLTSEWSDVYDRVVAASYTDKSLCKELCEHMNSSLDYSAFHAGREDEVGKPSEFPQSLVNPDEDIITAQIRDLEAALFIIRGDQLKKDGSYKMPEDYHRQEEVEVKDTRGRKKLVRKQTSD